MERFAIGGRTDVRASFARRSGPGCVGERARTRDRLAGVRLPYRAPRRSKEEGLVRAYVLHRLEKFGLVARTDRAGNVVADVPGPPDAETVVLQAHLDMVCEADAGAGTDPAVDGVFPVVADGWVHAPGTTLGADDGIGVAVALAIAAEAASDLAGVERPRGPPLQLLFTVDEEEDFSGAAGVDPELVTGRILLNLDSEQEQAIQSGPEPSKEDKTVLLDPADG